MPLSRGGPPFFFPTEVYPYATLLLQWPNSRGSGCSPAGGPVALEREAGFAGFMS